MSPRRSDPALTRAWLESITRRARHLTRHGYGPTVHHILQRADKALADIVEAVQAELDLEEDQPQRFGRGIQDVPTKGYL